MLRVDHNLLEVEGDYTYFNKALFTGIAFIIKDSQVTDSFKYSDGIKYDSYHNYFEYDNHALRYLRDSLEEDDTDFSCEPILLDGKRFSGIIYDFDDGYCIEEAIVDNGSILESVNFYKNGNIEEYDVISSGDYYQSYCFDMYNNIEFFSIKKKPYFVFEYKLESNTIRSLIMYGDLNKYYHSLNQQCIFFKSLDVSFLIKKKFNCFFYMEGDYIDNKFFSFLIEQGCFDQVHFLTLSSTNISEEEIQKTLLINNKSMKYKFI
ncbi:hypothetical protein [Vibrio palustris]|uniref:Uncharacterized protein n=1 Tax=Vibrio palustris TaxID=1918946 RepID=A0A1R4B5T9_9VIBR|nr:hypothetical protein [Vibrio palustris]SJL84294.1 hypothetical protein VPAL9027_02276 [Vibrio palustris]